LKVAVYYNNQDVRLQEYPDPVIGPGELKVRIDSCGLCGGDAMEWYLVHKAPIVLGHEPTGIVEEVGMGVSQFKPGDGVFIHHHVACMSCHYCRRGYYTMCEKFTQTHIYPCGFAEYVRVPADNVEHDVHLLPDSVSLEEGTLIEPLACVVKGIKLAGIQPGDTVAVVGSGFMGLGFIQLARVWGAGKIVAYDLSDWRLERALELGADAAFNSSRVDGLEALREINQGRGADSVADFALGLLLALCRNINRAEAHLRQNGWLVEDKEIPYFHFRGPELAGKTLGLIGCGAIGRALAQRVRGFDMKVLVSDPYLNPDTLGDLGELVPLESLLTESDFVSLHVPVTVETRGMLDAERLAQLKPTAYLINTARAAIIDEEALFEALASGQLAGAALDVFWDEPEIAPRWFNLDNVLLTPHLGGAADDVKKHQSAMIVEDLQALGKGETPARLVNPEVLSGTH
jgi:phosphoglycerate dehydrogenase-like enzyme